MDEKDPHSYQESYQNSYQLKTKEAEACTESIPLCEGSSNCADKDGTQSDEEELSGFDKALELTGSWDKYQKWVFFIAYVSEVFCGMHAVSAAFLSATPDFWCRVPGVDSNVHPEDLKNITLPWTEDGGYSRCEYYEVNNYTTSKNVHECSSWVFDDSVFQRTLVSDFSLVCGRLWLKATVQASYMSGLLVGSLCMGQLSDKFGRRTVTNVCEFLAIAVGIIASFANSFPFFLLLRFVLAFLNAGPMVVCFVLVMEIVKPGARTFTGMMYAFFFGSGIAILPGIAYFIRDWRYLQLAISLLNGVLISYYWLLPESPRWLASQGRMDEALVIMKKIAKVNKRQLPPDHIMVKLMTQRHVKQMSDSESDDNATSESSSSTSSCLVQMFRRQVALVRTPIMRRRCSIGFFFWFVSASAYYGLIFSGGNINANIFLMIFVSGSVEIPSVFFSIYVMKRIGRRYTMIGLFTATATCCLLIMAVPRDRIYINFFLVSLGKFFDTAVFAQAFLYTSELVPTVVRNVAVGTSSMFARIGCILTPFVVELLGQVHYALPSTLFGILSLLAAVLTYFLPETNNKKLPETIEEVEAMPK